MSEEPIPALIERLIQEIRAHHPERPGLIGVGGAQGSGKSFQARAFAREYPRIAHFSLDDVYLSQAERRKLAESVHPLFATRGAPGTHDIPLALRTIERLNRAREDEAVALPAFDKARDDRMPEPLWPRFVGRPDAILIEGWCLGATASLTDPAPLNALEAKEDADGLWRRAVAGALTAYQPFFASFDQIVYLQAPSFEIVRRWRGGQEEEMLGRPLDAAESAALDRFVQHYERITRVMLGGALRADWIVRLDENRAVISIKQRS